MYDMFKKSIYHKRGELNALHNLIYSTLYCTVLYLNCFMSRLLAGNAWWSFQNSLLQKILHAWLLGVELKVQCCLQGICGSTELEIVGCYQKAHPADQSSALQEFCSLIVMSDGYAFLMNKFLNGYHGVFFLKEQAYLYLELFGYRSHFS